MWHCPRMDSLLVGAGATKKKVESSKRHRIMRFQCGTCSRGNSNGSCLPLDRCGVQRDDAHNDQIINATRMIKCNVS